MTSQGTSSVNNSITGIVASVCSTEKTTLQDNIDYSKRFDENWPLLRQGRSFPLHDKIDHTLSPQAGSSPMRNSSVFSEIKAPVYIVYTWLLLCAFCTILYFPIPTDFVLLWVHYITFHAFKYAVLFNAICLWAKWVGHLTKPTLEPQMGSASMDPYLKEAIQVWCLFECLKDSKSKRGMIAAITQYLQAHVQESLPMYVYRQMMRVNYISDWSSDRGQFQIEEMLNEAFGPTALDDLDDVTGVILDIQTGEDGKVTPVTWHGAADSAFADWKSFRTSGIAKKFTHLINVVVTAGMCSTAGLTFKMGNVSLFSPIVTKKQLAAGDVFEAFYEAVSGFMKGGWRVFKTGEVSAFFMEDDKIAEFEKRYNNIVSWQGYAITGNLRKYTEIDENEYESYLKKSIESGEALLNVVQRSQTFERKYITDRLDRIRNHDVEFTQMRTRGGLRIAPFAVSLFGQSGCGKSALTSLTVNAGLLYNNLSADKDRIATWADNDKYASSIRSHINAIIFDDFANTKEAFLDFSPAYRLIQVINNIRYLAPMADVFLKGKVTLNPYFCVVSTNVEHLNAARFSNEPESVLRRLYHVIVHPKAEFCEKGILSKEKIEARFGKVADPDVWDLTVRYYQVQNKRYVNLRGMRTVEFEGKAMYNVSVKTYLRWVQIASEKHFAEEANYISIQDKTPKKCEDCGMVYCDCPLHPKDYAGLGLEMEEEEVLEPHSGEWEYYSGKTRSLFHRRAEILQRYYDHATTSSMLAANTVCTFWERFDFIPEKYICHPNILKLGLVFWREDLKQSLVTGNSFIAIMMFVLMYGVPRLSILFVLCTPCCMYGYTCATVQTYKLMVRNRILELKDVVTTFTSSWQFKYGIIGLGAIGIILATLRSKRLSLETNGGLSPERITDVQSRDDETDPWAKVNMAELPMSSEAKTTTPQNLAASMRTNLVGVVSDINKTTLGFYIASNFMLVPTHFVDEHGDRDIDIRCYKQGVDKVGSSFRDKISSKFHVKIPDSDFSLCFVTSGGSMKDFRKFLPENGSIKRCDARLVTRDIMDNGLTMLPTLYGGSTCVVHSKDSFPGGFYTLKTDTKAGMCMSPLISDMKGSFILGFHLGGKGKLGGCGTFTRAQADLALKELAEVPGVVLTASCGDLLEPNMGDFPFSSYGQPILKDTNIHPKSAVNFLTPGACIDVYGSTTGKATPHSHAVPTLISDSVSQVFGVPQQWGPPKMKGKGNYPFQATLVHSAVPSLPVGSILSTAVVCMKSITGRLKDKIPELFDVKPLSRVETVSGIMGKKFIDPMNFNTSPGFPLTGTKHPLLVDLDAEDYPHIGKPRTFTDEVWAEFDKVVGILRSGERCYIIWKACLKDEATKLTKDKVRVFQSAPLALQLLIRMYFLPLVRIIQMNPLAYECAVGVNAEGLEWEELWEAAMSKGRDRVLAGDYSKYDVRMPAQVVIAAFDILIDIAENCSYSEEDLHIMRMMVSEVVYPVVAYNGDLIQLFGTNPSGQNLTVIINSLVNSLLLRSCFYSKHPDGVFKDACSVITYGDDVLGTVSEQYTDFNHISYAAWLEKFDMKFTMPDKESTPTEFMAESDVDFLKRKCVYNEDLGHRVGLLSEDSIYKRLHCHLLSKELTLPMHSAENIQSSLHDWFFYGREVFEDRRAKLRTVAHCCDITHLCPALEYSYDKRVNVWKHKYLGEELIEDDTVVLDIQCGDLAVETANCLDLERGTIFDPFFWWEHIAADLSLPFLGVVWTLIYKGYRIKTGLPTRGWLYFITLTTGGLISWNMLKFVVFFYAQAYIIPFCAVHYIDFMKKSLFPQQRHNQYVTHYTPVYQSGF